MQSYSFIVILPFLAMRSSDRLVSSTCNSTIQMGLTLDHNLILFWSKSQTKMNQAEFASLLCISFCKKAVLTDEHSVSP